MRLPFPAFLMLRKDDSLAGDNLALGITWADALGSVIDRGDPMSQTFV
jgi:hypothetical protein